MVAFSKIADLKKYLDHKEIENVSKDESNRIAFLKSYIIFDSC